MPTVTIEDKQYDMDSLPQEVQSQVKNVTYCDNRLKELQAEIAMIRTARSAYMVSLMKAMPKDS